VTATAPAWPPGICVAERAATAGRAGPCTLCPYAVLRGQRVARLLDGSGWAHAWCIAAMRPGRRAVTEEDA
jgi:hypothetical protein